MSRQNPLKLFQVGILAAVCMSFTPLLHAADPHSTIQRTSTQPDASQPQQQATPTQPASENEPLDGDETELT